MKTQLPYVLLGLAAAAGIFLSQPTPTSAQAAGDDPVVAALVAEIVQQQATLQENQTKLEEKLAAIAEDVRQSRLFAARGGKK